MPDDVDRVVAIIDLIWQRTLRLTPEQSGVPWARTEVMSVAREQIKIGRRLRPATASSLVVPAIGRIISGTMSSRSWSARAELDPGSVSKTITLEIRIIARRENLVGDREVAENPGKDGDPSQARPSYTR